MGAQEKRRLKRIREYVINRDGMICCYCDFPLTQELITMEHIVPDSQRGTFNTTNLTVSCSACNNKRGNKPFFEYCKNFNWSDEKIDKYKRLYYNNLRIKVLNISKEECLPQSIDENNQAVPLVLIKQACQIMSIKNMDFSIYENNYYFEIKFNELADKKQIKFCFEQLIRLIEADSW